jgi:hypothetical protein
MAEKAIYDILSNDLDVVAMVDTRIAPLTQAQFAAFPLIVYQITDYEPFTTQSGAIVGGKTTISVTSYAETYKDATLLQLKIRKALGFKKGTYGELEVKNIEPQGKSALTEQLPDGSETPIYGVTQDYVILHKDN